jgi:hypothetical protein
MPFALRPAAGPTAAALLESVTTAVAACTRDASLDDQAGLVVSTVRGGSSRRLRASGTGFQVKWTTTS